MAKQYFIIVDTETTNDDQVFDFAAIVVDAKGIIHASYAVIVGENASKSLFVDPTGRGLWSAQYAAEKKAKYEGMLESGSRMLASSNAVNRWLEKVNAQYSPKLTAYNIAFDRTKCANTNIDLSIFADSFCLWHLATEIFASSKAYRAFVLHNHFFGNRTAHGNMTYKTNAEVMAHFLTGEDKAEPHTALEDAQYFELPILLACIKKRDWKKKIGIAYNWKNFQLRDHFKA